MCTPVERESLKALATQREALESEMASVLELLNAPGQPGVRGALVDREGFPRADIDVHAVRTNRHRLAGVSRHTVCAHPGACSRAGAVLTTDYERLSASLERGLASFHAAAQASGLVGGTQAFPAALEPKRQRLEPAAAVATTAPPQASAFACVDEVSASSPAQEAGLRVGDLLLRLGAAASLGAAPGVVAAAADARASLELLVMRSGVQLALHVSPRPWAGRGVLGCHLRPLT